MIEGASKPDRWDPGLRDRLRWIWSFWRPHRGFIVILAVLTLISSAVAIAYPLIFKTVLDRLIADAGLDELARGRMARDLIDPETIRGILGILALIALGRFVARLYPAFRHWMNMKLELGIRQRVFGSVLRKDHRFFNSFRTGDLVTRLMDDLTEYPKLSWFSCSGIFRALESGSKLVFCVGAMLLLDWRLSLVSLLPLPAMLFFIYRFRSRLSQAYGAQQKAISETNDLLEATFAGVRIVKAFTAEKGQSKALWRQLSKRIGIQLDVQRLYAAVQILDTVTSRLGQLVVLAFGGALVVRGETTVGTIYALYVYLDMLVEPMMDLPNLLVTSRQAFVCMDREEEVLRFPGLKEAGGAIPLRKPIESVEFERVSVSYDGQRDALREVSFQARRGERIAVVGAIASGKSTLLRTLALLVTPRTGTIRVNGTPLDRIDCEDLRRGLGYTPQEALLFSESIRENIELGRTGGNGTKAELGRIGQLLEMVHLTEEIEEMPQGVESVLGQKGTLVSGGQRQRIAIARSLYSRPEVLLFDDCTASLDAENEDRLWAGIEEIAPETIAFVVSHRLATIRRADRVLVFEGGRLVDAGGHSELARRSPVYQRFLEREAERERVLGIE